MGHAYQENQGAQHFRIAQLHISHVLLFGLAIFLHHVLHFGHDCVLSRAGNGILVMQSRIDQRLPGFCQGGEGCDQVRVVQAAVGANAFGQSESQVP